ncbi:MAG: hypothetical protein ACRDYB_02700 [Acidimicrobiales bacterium]
MTFRRNLRVVRRRLSRAMRPGRVFAPVILVTALGVTVWLLMLVVSQNAVSSAPPSATTPPTSAPHATTPKTASHASTPTTVKPKVKAKTPTTTPVGQTVPLGVYAGPGAPVAATVFSADAGAPVPFAFDYLDGSSWSMLANPMWFVKHWDGSGFRMIWGVPLLPKVGASLATGATGAYNRYFTELASTLVTHGLANSVIMLGWDPQDQVLAWAVNSPAAATDYVAYWRQVVTAMRSVPNEQFQFAWDSAPGSSTLLPTSVYPGDRYVDIVATDAFDEGSSVVGGGWNAVAEQPYGPDWFSTFAAKHHKPLMIAKWGVVPTTNAGGGDNSAFVSQFLRWADRQRLFAAVTWDYGAWAVTGGGFPKAAATLHKVAEAGAVVPIARAVDS